MYSVRMRAEKEGRHISGAERITDDIMPAAQSLIDRALSHEKGKPDFINISLEELKTPIKKIISLPLVITHVSNVSEGRELAKRLLLDIGIPLFCIEKAINLLENGAAGGESLRGAMIMNMRGERLEPDRQRGIRASRMDITEEAAAELARSIEEAGLAQYYPYISEALVLATKVASVKGTIAELCWSDDPSYTAGYVASGKGYVRIPHMKPPGNPLGGRVFFVNGIDLDGYIHEMEKTPILVNRFGGIKELKK